MHFQKFSNEQMEMRAMNRDDSIKHRAPEGDVTAAAKAAQPSANTIVQAFRANKANQSLLSKAVKSGKPAQGYAS